MEQYWHMLCILGCWGECGSKQKGGRAWSYISSYVARELGKTRSQSCLVYTSAEISYTCLNQVLKESNLSLGDSFSSMSLQNFRSISHYSA